VKRGIPPRGVSSKAKMQNLSHAASKIEEPPRYGVKVNGTFVTGPA
jgi:hypothetical protein